jgi:hypothetical protein
MGNSEELARAASELIMDALAYQLYWDTRHLEGTDEDATLVPFEGDMHVCGWLGTALLQVPDPVLFEANFKITRQSDYPCNDVNWPLMSRRMLEVLRRVGDIPHRLIPVRLVDREASGSKRYLPDGSLRPEVFDDRFAAVQLTEHIDVVDWERSTFRPRRSNPKGVWFDTLVLLEPTGGLPPLFRLTSNASMLLVSAKAARALEEASIIGIKLLPLRGSARHAGADS